MSTAIEVIEERNRKNSARYRKKKRETHVPKTIWILKEDMEHLEMIAIEKEWFTESGRRAGDIDFQIAFQEILRAGFKALGY